jgi:hypothetical protein
MWSPYYRVPEYIYSNRNQWPTERKGYDEMTDDMPDQTIMMAIFEETAKREKGEKNVRDYENVLGEKTAAALAANPYKMPVTGRSMVYDDYRFVDAGCTSCSRKDNLIASLTSKNAELLRSNMDLRELMVELQEEVEVRKKHTRIRPQRWY